MTKALMRIDFYLTSAATMQGTYPLVCRIAAKAYAQNQRAYILCENAKEAEYLDTLLWTFDEASFLPHQLAHANPCENTAPIILGNNLDSFNLAGDYAILFNLTAESLALKAKNAGFSRLIEIVSAAPEAREAARERYRHYRSEGHELHSHQL